MPNARSEDFVPRKLTLELILKAKEYLTIGNDLENTAAMCHVSLDTMKAWQRDGQRRSDEQPDKTMEEWLDEGIYTPLLNAALVEGIGGATRLHFVY